MRVLLLIATIFAVWAQAQETTTDEGSGDIELLDPSATLTEITFDDADSEFNNRPYPPSPRERCGRWSDWKQVKCWWPDVKFEDLPLECTNVSIPSRYPDYVNKFVNAKEKEKYDMIVDEYQRRGSPPKCGYCSKSFECRARNVTEKARPWCRKQEYRLIDASCDDQKACSVSLVEGGCPEPLFLNNERVKEVNDLIDGGDSEGALLALFALSNPRELDDFEGWDRRRKRQADYDDNRDHFRGNEFNWNGRPRHDEQPQKRQPVAQPSYQDYQYSPQHYAQPSYDQGSQYSQNVPFWGPDNYPLQSHNFEQQYDFQSPPSYRPQSDQQLYGYAQRQYRPQPQAQGYFSHDMSSGYNGYDNGYQAAPRHGDRLGQRNSQIRPDFNVHGSEDFWPGRAFQSGQQNKDSQDKSSAFIIVVGASTEQTSNKNEQMAFLGGLLHGTNCASTGKECLCCCGGYIPDMETGECKDLRAMMPGLDNVFGDLAQNDDYATSTMDTTATDESEDSLSTEESVVSSTTTL